jgi:xanthine dehydrogenase accessory factor
LIRDGFLKRGTATAEELDRVACPVGLDIGAVSVPEIAVSILSQYIQKRRDLASSS